MVEVEQAKTLGFNPPTEDTFAVVADRFLGHQKARLTPKAYERESGIVESHLKAFFTGPPASIRRVDVQRYVTERSADATAHTVQQELNIAKHLFRLAVEWESIPNNPA